MIINLHNTFKQKTRFANLKQVYLNSKYIPVKGGSRILQKKQTLF